MYKIFYITIAIWRLLSGKPRSLTSLIIVSTMGSFSEWVETKISSSVMRLLIFGRSNFKSMN